MTDALAPCRFYVQTGSCSRGKRCRFVHDPTQVKKKAPKEPAAPKTPNTPSSSEVKREKVDSPQIKKETPQRKKETPQTKKETPQIKKETPQIKKEVPQINKETPTKALQRVSEQTPSPAAPKEKKSSGKNKKSKKLKRKSEDVAENSSPRNNLQTNISEAQLENTNRKRKRTDDNKANPRHNSLRSRKIIDFLMEITRKHIKFAEAYNPIFEMTKEDGWATTKGNVGALGGSCGELILGLDCEMVATKTENNSLARVTLVALSRPLQQGKLAEIDVLLDRIVAFPGREVTDYRKGITGLDATSFESADCFRSYEEVHAAILSHVSEDCVLVGHSLNNDLNSLKLTHKNVLDTAFIFDSPLKHQFIGLKEIVLHLFDSIIQPTHLPHDSKRDAAWPLEIVRQVVDKTVSSGTAVLDGKECHSFLKDLLKIPLPPNLLKRIQAFQIPQGVASVNDVTAALNIPSDVKFTVRDMKFKGKDGKAPLGATIITFENPDDAKRVFQAVDLTGMKTDLDGFYQKQVHLDQSKYPGLRHFYVKAYCDPGHGNRALSQPNLGSPSTGILGAAPTARKTPRFCPQCGTKVNSGWKFCSVCGDQLN
eukprot:m.41553 g.41553  ORF g.41553 m.41553 type:complete len:596 (-) comp9779_c0_seq1:116-1903(-)